MSQKILIIRIIQIVSLIALYRLWGPSLPVLWWEVLFVLVLGTVCVMACEKAEQFGDYDTFKFSNNAATLAYLTLAALSLYAIFGLPGSIRDTFRTTASLRDEYSDQQMICSVAARADGVSATKELIKSAHRMKEIEQRIGKENLTVKTTAQK